MTLVLCLATGSPAKRAKIAESGWCLASEQRGITPTVLYSFLSTSAAGENRTPAAQVLIKELDNTTYAIAHATEINVRRRASFSVLVVAFHFTICRITCVHADTMRWQSDAAVKCARGTGRCGCCSRRFDCNEHITAKLFAVV